ncbi:kama family protein [Hypomontagnella monticulosa]|nr:kama family protein [Hypomontagnella monticulosa]
MISSSCRVQQALARGKGGIYRGRTSSTPLRKLSTTIHFRNALATHSSLKYSELPPTWYSRRWVDLSEPHHEEFWRAIPLWRDVSREDFFSWDWSTKNVVEANEKKTNKKLLEFLDVVLPDIVPRTRELGGLQSRDEFMGDVVSGLRKATMSLRVMPYVLSRINWSDPANDPIFRQFIPIKSIMMDDHKALTLDSLEEKEDEAVPGVIHRYPDKALFLPISACPTYCLFCTRSYAVGPDTALVDKLTYKTSLKKLDEAYAYMESQEGLHDIVVSGGDAYYLQPHILESIGDRLIGMKNIERFRIASKGLAVSPQRFLDPKDKWTETLLRLSDKARKAGKHMALHTHFNHPNEISWITEKASRKLLESGLTVRNQTVLLRGINDDADTMLTLIKKLAKMAIQPYYVYQCDMVPKAEHFRTPLQTILDIEAQIQGTVAGFMMPKFVVDLPGGGGKRAASLRESYDRKTGVSTFTQPAVKGRDRENKVYKYYDPVDTLQTES